MEKTGRLQGQSEGWQAEPPCWEAMGWSQVSGLGRGGQSQITIPIDSRKKWTIIPTKQHCTFKIMILEARFPPALGAVSENQVTANWWFLTLNPI